MAAKLQPDDKRLAVVGLLLSAAATLSNRPVAAEEIPATMRQCEENLCESGGGGTWTFKGRTGKARWTIGVEADLQVLRYDNGEVLIRRVDVPGQTYGATALYAGKVHGNRIDGTVDYNWPGHFHNGKLTRPWYAIIGESAPGLPPPVSTRQSSSPPPVPTFPKIDPASVPAVVKQADALYAASNFHAAAPLYGEAAQLGDHHSQLKLARLFAGGSGIDKNCEEALRLVHAAADAGYNPARADLGRYYNFGWCMKRDGATAAKWFEEGAAHGDTDAMGALGMMYVQGLVIHQDLNKGMQWIQKAAALNDADAMASLGMLYSVGTRVPADYAQANKWLAKSAALGNADAMNGLGLVYEKGLGVPRDLDQAHDWYQRAAALGHAEAKQHLQAFTEIGYVAGVTGKDVPNAPQLFDLNAYWDGYYEFPGDVFTIRLRQVGLNIVAERVFTTSGAAMGRHFFRGSIDPASQTGRIELAEYKGDSIVLQMAQAPVKQSGWNPATLTILDPDHIKIGNHESFQRVSTPGTADVPCERSNRYHVNPVFAAIRAHRAGSVGEIALAACWYYVAASGGSARSMSDLGLALHEGLGVDRDEAQALEWLQKGAEHGDYYGADLLADIYKRGEGVAADPSKASEWRAKADAIKADLDRKAAAQRRHDARERAELAGLVGLAMSMQESFLSEILHNPNCDVYGTTGDRVSGVYAARLQQRANLMASGECD